VSAPEDVLVRRENGVLIVTINRPGQRNAVNGAVSAGIAAALDELDATPELRAGVLHGAGTAFCAGMDLKAFAAGEPGGGFEIVLACDLVTAGKSARFGLPEVKRGLAARGGGVFRLPRRLPPAVAMEVIVTGAPLDAARAERFGLVNRLVEDGQALTAALELAELIAANAPMSVRASKRVATESAGWPLGEEFERQQAYLEPVFASADAAEGVAAFRERRDPKWHDR
jgi:enoyl-CoA hydratase